MKHRVLQSAIVLALLLALAGGQGFVSAPAAQAATRYTLTASGAGVTTTDTARTLTVWFKKNGKAVKSAKVQLQYLSGTRWVTEKTVTIKKGKATVKVKHSTMSRTYRFRVSGKATSKSFLVHFVPASFTLSGSGAGHGVGMSQYGAYQYARSEPGATAADILGYYYPGTVVDEAANNPRTVKVQVLGPPSDSRTSTTLAIAGGGFTITSGTDTTPLATTAPQKPVTIGVSGSKVTAKVILASGTSKTLSAASLRFAWNPAKATVTVAGAHGSYRYGSLQVTVIGARPNVVNELAMNTEYLYGIDEMPSSWGTAGGMEALKAQVIAARSYVIWQASRLKSRPGEVDAACNCQVYDDPNSQNFTGWKKAGDPANAPWREAVDATMTPATVLVLRPAGTTQIAETPYFASSGSGEGAGTAFNADVFGTAPLPYLAHVPDPYSAASPGNPHLKWTKQLSQAQLRTLLGVSGIRSIAVTDRYPGGLVKSLTATTASGTSRTVTKKADDWRRSLGVPGPWIGTISGR